MYILNITFLVAEPVIPVWSDWVRQLFIPSLTETGRFASPQLARIHSDRQEDGISFALQFSTASLEHIDEWMGDNAGHLQQVCTGRFAGNVLFFATTLELIS